MSTRPAVLLLLLLGAAVAHGVAVVTSAVFNEMMGSWRQAPATFEDAGLGSVRTVNSCELLAICYHVILSCLPSYASCLVCAVLLRAACCLLAL